MRPSEPFQAVKTLTYVVFSTELSSAIWSLLPIELLQEILLFLAVNNHNQARSLRLVSRHVNIWMLPILFQSVSLTTPGHVTHFTSTLLPKRRIYIPLLRSNLHTTPRPLSSYYVRSLAMVINARLPSMEVAMAKVAPALTNLQNLAITSQNLTSHAHWLRKFPIHPQNIMLLHFGRPQYVNFGEPLFKQVTHLYTSVLDGHRRSSVADIPELTHLAVHTRFHLDDPRALSVSRSLIATLRALPRLKMLILTIDAEMTDDVKLQTWKVLLEPCLADERFYLVPYFVHPRLEWNLVVSGSQSVWDRALEWRLMEGLDVNARAQYLSEKMMEGYAESVAVHRTKKAEAEWEIDLVQRDSFSEMDEDPTEHRAYTLFFNHR